MTSSFILSNKILTGSIEWRKRFFIRITSMAKDAENPKHVNKTTILLKDKKKERKIWGLRTNDTSV